MLQGSPAWSLAIFNDFDYYFELRVGTLGVLSANSRGLFSCQVFLRGTTRNTMTIFLNKKKKSADAFKTFSRNTYSINS